MNTNQIEALKQESEVAHAALNSEKARLAAAGFKSAQRYVMLKDLKAAADKAFVEYSKFAKSQIMGELNKIIAADRPARAAAARSRSAWKQAKFDAANAK